MEDNSAQANAVKHAYDPAASIDELYAALRITSASGLSDASQHILNRLNHEFRQSGDIRFMLETAIFSRNLGNVEHAAEQFTIIQNKFPHNGHAYLLHADLLVGVSELDSARRVLESGWKRINEKRLRLDIIYRILKLKSRQHAGAASTPLCHPRDCRSEPRAAFVMMVKDENDIIKKNLEHHHKMGFRKFVILDNNSRDGTTDTIDCFSRTHQDSIVIRISDPIPGYFQGEKTGAAVDFAKSYLMGVGQQIDWIFIIDADEFLSGPLPTLGISDLIVAAEHRGANYMVFPLCNVAPHQKMDVDFVHQDIYEDFQTVAAYPTRLVMKNAFHAELQCRITTGNHTLDCDDLDPDKCLVGPEVGWKIAHLPYRSTAQTAQKILNGSAAIQARGDAAGIGGHWMALSAEMRHDAEATAAKKMEIYRKETLAYSRDNSSIFRL